MEGDSERYGLNVGRFEQDYPRWHLEAGTTGRGLRARPKGKSGGWLEAATLDDLARLIEGAGAALTKDDSG
jgi:hypothetical protein